MNFYYYKISNIKNGSFYIGITTDFEKRRKQHFSNLKRHVHPNYKMQKDYDLFGPDAFIIEIIDTLDCNEEEGYKHEYDLIQQLNATASYNIAEGGQLNPVYSPQIIQKIKETAQSKFPNILQYEFDGKQFHLIKIWPGIREICRNADFDFRAVQTCIKKAQQHHNYYWVKDGEQQNWLNTFLARFTCCVAKINEDTKEIEDTALTIKEFAVKYNTTYERIYASLIQHNRCERKYKFIRITAKQFAEINQLSL